MARLRKIFRAGLVLTLAAAQADGEEERRPGLSEFLPLRPFLRQERPSYHNYAFLPYSQYPDHAFPYQDNLRIHHDAMGNYLLTGYDLYRWEETRSPGLEYGSAIFTDMNRMRGNFYHILVGRDSYKDLGYSIVLGDGQIARFTPLTLSQVTFNGARLDLSTPRLQATILGSRMERPRYFWDGGLIPPWSSEDTDYADASTLLLGGRAQAEIGGLRLGLNGVNMHVYQSTREDNSLKGVLRPEHPMLDWVVVRFGDDSPADGEAGAVVQEVRLIVNGEERQDLRPAVIRHRSGAPIRVGSISRATGEFRALIYNTFTGYYQSAPFFYRGRDEVPLYADYFYRLDHEAGVDVSGDVDLEGLLAAYQVESPEAVLHADGEDQLVFLFDLSREPRVESVEVEALLGNDYRVEVATLRDENPRARNHATRYRSAFYRTALQAEGNVRDLSNLKRRRIAVGENTALFVYSADANLRLAGVEIKAEYARSDLYARYPAELDGEPIYRRGPRSARRGAAYYINFARWFGRGGVGGEYFSIHPDFRTEMRAYVPFEVALTSGHLAALVNQTVYWELVQDNEDGDRYPDKRLGNVLGSPRDRLDGDPDGVFPGLDADRDGLPETNRNGNGLPDYEEPFLMWDVEPNEYTYGMDRNNNDEPDHREDDLDPDYPYDHDQRGYHLFGRVGMTSNLSLTLGRYDVEEIAAAGRNRSTYVLLTYLREGQGRLDRLFLESHLRRVEDDIADEFSVLVEKPGATNLGSRGGLLRLNAPTFSNFMRRDLQFYKDSWVEEIYGEARLSPWPALKLDQKLRLRLNWQQGGELHSGLFQSGRRLDSWTVVSQVQYTRHLGRLRVVPQFKFMLLSLVDQGTDRPGEGSYGSRRLYSELRTIPILRLEYPLLPRTAFLAGIQGWGPLPYRVEDQVRERNGFEQRTAFFTLSNRSAYFGYDLYTIVGIRRDQKQFDDLFQRFRNLDGWSFFVRTLVGFTEYGPSI